MLPLLTEETTMTTAQTQGQTPQCWTMTITTTSPPSPVNHLPMCKLIVLMIPLGSITVFSTSPIDCLSPFHCVLWLTLALHISALRFQRNDCWLRVALQRNLAISHNVAWLFDTFFSCGTAQDLLMLVFFHCVTHNLFFWYWFGRSPTDFMFTK